MTRDWLVEGATVAVHLPDLGIRSGPRVRLETVARIGKRDVVLSDGSRWSLRWLTPSPDTSAGVYLRNPADPQVVRDQARDEEDRTARIVTQAMVDWRKTRDRKYARIALRTLARRLDIEVPI